MSTGIAIHEAGVILEADHAFAALFGPAEELAGTRVLDLVASVSRAQAAPVLAAGGGPVELAWVRRDGSCFQGELRAMSCRLSLRAAQVAVVRDLTGEHRREEEREQLLRNEREARGAAEEAERRAEFLAEASRLLGASLDLDTPLASVVRLAVPYLADWCVADALDATGMLRRVATHIDPAKLDEVRALERQRLDPEASEGIAKVLRTGRPVIGLDMPPEQLQDGSAWWTENGLDAEHARIVRSLGLASFLSVPLIAHGATIGALTFVSARNPRRYGSAELGIAMNLAERAAVAMVNTLLYRDLGVRREEARRLVAELVAVEEAERRRIARDLHDSAGQILSTVKVALERIAAGCPPGEQEALLAKSIELTGMAIAQTRSLIFDLYPTMLDDLGLAATLRWYAEKVPSGLCRMEVYETGERRPLAPALGGYLYRAVTELMSNSMKHARAEEVTVLVRWLGDRVRISVADNGSGFVAEEALSPLRRRGLGLGQVRERIALLGGQVLIDSTPGRGTQVLVEVPLEPAAPEKP